MRRRDDRVCPPGWVTQFPPPGEEYADPAQWQIALAAWASQREEWLSGRGLRPNQVAGFDAPLIGDAPFDWDSI